MLLTEAQSEYGHFHCEKQSPTNQFPQLGGNSIYVLTGNISIVGLCGMTEAEFQAKYPGIDDGTKIYGPANDADIIEAARKLLMGEK